MRWRKSAQVSRKRKWLRARADVPGDETTSLEITVGEM